MNRVEQIVRAAGSLLREGYAAAQHYSEKEPRHLLSEFDTRIDDYLRAHIVLTVADIERTCDFYSNVLEMRTITFGDNRTALAFGTQKINLHELGKEIDPKAGRPTPGSADLCFISSTPIDDVITHLRGHSVPIIAGPVQRTGAMGTLISVYFRDPDLNLIEVSNYVEASPS